MRSRVASSEARRRRTAIEERVLAGLDPEKITDFRREGAAKLVGDLGTVLEWTEIGDRNEETDTPASAMSASMVGSGGRI